MVEPVGTGTYDRKLRTGIDGFDCMSEGGLPVGKVSAVVGTAGAGKTVFAMQSMIHCLRSNPGVGVVVSFEQSTASLTADLASFDWNAAELIEQGRLIVIDGRPRADVLFSGAFDISGLLAMVEGAAAPDRPACVVFDGIDTLMTLLSSSSSQRLELLRLQNHIQCLGTTAILTLKANPATSGGFEEIALYMADCVVEMRREGQDSVSRRSIWIQKYRGSGHSLARVPFIVTFKGVEVEGVDSRPNTAQVSNDRLSMGVTQLDEMLGGGLFRGTSTLISGAPGTAKTTLGLAFLNAMCQRGERALGICFDERPNEIVRNVSSVGIDLTPHIASGLLHLHGIANQTAGPDEFAYEIATAIRQHRARHLLIDPISVFTQEAPAQNAVRRIIQLCKREGITVILTSLLDRNALEAEASRSYVSTICDTWVHLTYVIHGGERNRALTIIKSRGTAHSNQVGELLLDDNGLTIARTYTEEGEVLMGSLRWQKERANEQAIRDAEEEAARHYREAEQSVEELSGRVTSLSNELEAKREELKRLSQKAAMITQLERERRSQLSRLRSAGEPIQQAVQEVP
ncbi:circadian clock protein KaiC [Oryzicola mucosus]|uniref:non-specific serine/threonine protein kinase n=1 Tax=Oryzicola mucosus TaxID=2767425 RepID=A0A8J6PYY9_9HYPH|nr:circadian clock protein KaiC [Oryzicola mucosus]MBD0416987.1 circadian clock protein KaiC [Oryzicola mucosus]